MRWFQGNIVEAVTQSKARNAVFVVFIEGQDDVSQRIASAIDENSVSSKLEGDNFVSIHLESGSQTFSQFSQIYRNPTVPSLYFIGRNGSPIKIVTEVVDSKSLLEEIVHVENVHFGRSNTNEAAAAAVTKPSSTNPKPSETSATEEPPSQPSTSSAPLDERVERAKELLEEKRLKKQAQEEEEARQKEMKRRKEGQNVQELRRLQQEQEMKQLKEERLRDKRLEQEARQRVLEQIAQDRAARNSRNVTSTPSPAVSGAAVASTTPSNSNEARLQFRLPDGSTHSHIFQATATLADVRQYIESNITLPYRNFVLATVFPRHEFTSQDNSSTLRELSLVPSAAILIVPAGGNAGTLQSSPGLFGFAQTVLLFMTYPLTRLFSFIRVFVFGAPPPAAGNAGSGSAAGGPSAGTQSPAGNQQDRRPQRRSGGAYRRAGNSNVHRLHQSNSSSDDENNTWNGNSTQQM